MLYYFYIGIDDEADTNATLSIKCLISAQLTSKGVCSEYKMTQSDIYICNWWNAFTIWWINKCVGTIAATQMTLNTFHFAGVSAESININIIIPKG